MSTSTQPTTFADLCRAPGCERTDQDALGLCHKHYAYYRRHGVYEPRIASDTPISLTESEAAWLAAVIDCEGTITMMQSARGRSYACWPAIFVGNTDIRLIRRLEDMTGCGTVRCVVPKNPRAKPQWHWSVRKQADVRAILLGIRGHLLLKRQQADIVIALPRPNEKANSVRKTARDLITDLNRKGFRPT